VNLEVVRKVSPEELEPLERLFGAARAHDGHAPLGEHKWLDLVHGGREGYCGVVATEPGHGHPLGYAHLSRHHDPANPHWGLEIVVHPTHRGVGVEAALVERALELVGSAGGGHVHLWVFQPSDMHDALAHRFGLRRGRDLHHMRVLLPTDQEAGLPPGIRLRPFEPGQDDQAWLDLNNSSFEHHPEQGAWSLETLHRRMAEDWFDPDDLLMATDDAGLAGFNWTKLDHEAKSGEIYIIAVHPSRQGSGLGRALSIAGLEHMATKGMGVGTLYVDSRNKAAVRMYEQIGFEVHHTDRAYVTDVAGS
jgi:mycothiol synthase